MANNIYNKVNPEDLPKRTTRSDWSRILHVPLYVLQREERKGRLKNSRIGWNIVYTREDVIDWLNRYRTEVFVTEE
jgi:hypothetical protein